MQGHVRETRLWRRTQRLTAVLLAAWAAVTFGLVFFAPSLDFRFFGWPFNFWAASQGAMLFYVGLTAVAAWRMERLEAEEESPDAGQAPEAERR